MLWAPIGACLLSCLLLSSPDLSAQSGARAHAPQTIPTGSQAQTELESTQEWNQRLQELVRSADAGPRPNSQEYRIGPEDLLEISVFEAPELDRSVRVSASGEIALPWLVAVKAAGLTPRELEFVLQELLRRAFMKDPHVSVFVREMQSHPVSVFGAVEKPGVFQIRGSKTLLEILSLAEGLALDAGDTVIVMRRASFRWAPDPNSGSPEKSAASSTPTVETAEGGGDSSLVHEPAREEAVEVNLKDLLESGDPRFNVPVYPGDIVKVTRAGVVYVVGEVKKPGGFVLKSNENISVLQALALAQGLTRTSSKSKARIIRTDESTGERIEIATDLSKILAGKAPDPILQPKDIVFVPNSAARSGLFRAGEAAISVVSGVIIWRR